MAFEDDAQRISSKRYYLPSVEIKDYNVMIWWNFFNPPITNKITYNKIRKIVTDQGDDYTTGCLLEYTYFKNYYKIIAIDLSKQQALVTDPKAIQQIGNGINGINRAGKGRRINRNKKQIKWK